MALILLCLVVQNGSATARPTWGVNIYGFSHHFISERDSRDSLHEINPGFGIRMTLGSPKASWFIIEGGVYSDTFENPAQYLTVGPQFRIVRQARIGFLTGIYASDSHKEGAVVFVLTPLATYRLGACTVNVVLLPKFREINPWNTLGAYLTIKIR